MSKDYAGLFCTTKEIGESLRIEDLKRYIDFLETELNGQGVYLGCPKCKKLLPDYDGPVIAHFGNHEGYPDGCGYCTHPALNGDECDICGAIRDSEEWETAKKRHVESIPGFVVEELQPGEKPVYKFDTNDD